MPSREPDRVLLTGGGGFIGSHLARALAARGHDTHATVRLGRPRPQIEGVTPHQVELTDATSVSRLVDRVRPAAVIHAAASHPTTAATTRGRDSRSDTVEATRAVVSACRRRGVASLIQLGSSTVYAPSRAALRESDPLAPQTERGRHKLEAEQLVTQAGDDLRVVVLRLFRVYGAGESPDRLVPRLVAALRDGTPLAVPAQTTVRDYVHVDDVVAAAVQSLGVTDNALVVNIGTGLQTSVEELVALAENLSGRHLHRAREPFPVSALDIDHWCADITRARADLGWEPEVALSDGLGRLLAEAGVDLRD